MRSPILRLRDILQAIQAIERYLPSSEERFQQYPLVQVWCVYHLQIIGEAARHLPEDLRKRAPEIPWQDLVGMRNILVHGYFSLDPHLIWTTVTRDLPVLKTAVRRLLSLMESTENPY